MFSSLVLEKLGAQKAPLIKPMAHKKDLVVQK